ncbi:MAG TPA: beta-propeller fold lactonase family protein [Gaiellales bacterium]
MFTLANQTSGNRVLVFARGHDGTLASAGSVSTGGAGTGVTATTQGALALSPDGRRLYAVNGGSGTIAVFAVHGAHLARLAVVPSGGAGPASLAVGHGRVYVVNAGALNVVGFRVTGGGLRRIHGGSAALAPGDAGPAQVSLNPAGTALAVTNTASNTIDTVTLRRDGAIRRLRSFASAGSTPFGFGFTRDGVLVVSDAHQAPTSAATSYRIGHTGTLRLLSGPVSANQLAACWVAIAGRIAYTANAGSGTISAFRVDSHGRLHLRGVAASPGSTSTPLDESVTPGGGYLDVLTSGLHSITSYRVGSGGALTPVGSVGGLPASDTGVASS